MPSQKWLIALCYLLVLALAGIAVRSELTHIDEGSLTLARERGSALFQLIELTRDWNARHGGVYVPVTEHTSPNPYLEHPRRDLETVDGQVLTMINPAFMTRQIAEIAEHAAGVRFHITSLNPIRPQNSPDPWEAEALHLFETKQAIERLELVSEAGVAFYRYMAPLAVKQPCLKCHEKQGYKLGDVRGGISVSMPAASQLAIRDQQKARTVWGYGSAAVIIAALLHFAIWRTGQHIRSLRRLADEQERLVSERTANLSESNRRLKAEILERERVENRLRVSAAAMQNLSEGVIVTDSENRIIEVNPGFCAITGYRPGEVIGKNPRVFASGRHGSDYYNEMWGALETAGHWEGEIWNRRKDGSVYPQWLSISAISDTDTADSSGKYVATFADITERKEAEELLRHKAQTDPLTGLPNRALFHDRVSMALNSARRYQELFAVIYIDLDHFKEVNDGMGHAAGDELLIEAADRMTHSIRDSDTIARLGGDEFAIVLPKLASLQECEEIADRIVRALAEPFELPQGTARISGSAGVAFYPQHGRDVQTLMRAADQALYAVKRLGRNGYQVSNDNAGSNSAA